MNHRAGFVAIVGPPNAGKSTLLNRLVGEKMAIVSRRPQSTRTRITGVRNLPGAQIVFVDTPGLHSPSGRFGELMLRTVERALEDVDLVCWVADASAARRADPGLERLRTSRAPVYCCLNKIDLITPRARVLPAISSYRERFPFSEIVPISAEVGTNCDRLLDLVAKAMPERPAYFPPDRLTDQPETFFVAEVIREKIFEFTHQEVPYACAVQVVDVVERARPDCLYVRATVFVEHESQKGIVIGKGGGMLKRIGVAARTDLERFFGIKVYLELSVRVRRGWRKDEVALKEFGFMLTS